MSKTIAVIGATGAQGLPVIRHLLAPSKDGSPSPWKVRALTRNPDHERATELKALGAEIVQGSFMDPNAIHELFKDVYGAFVNTDGFTVGAAAETHAAFIIWEIAQEHELEHFVWSNLDYVLPLGNYKSTYTCDHSNAKGRFGKFLMSQPNLISEEKRRMWTVFTTGPYMDLLYLTFSPFAVREDGTRVFKSPMGHQGSIPVIALDDLGWWARYIFDNAPLTTGKDLEVASQPIAFPEIVETFSHVTGLPAEYESVSMDEYFKLWNGEIPVATEVPEGKTFEENFRAWWAMWRDNIVQRDMDWIKSVHPPTTLEMWMREHHYTGELRIDLIKGVQDGSMNLRRVVQS